MNPFNELKESKARVITLVVYAAVCLVAGLAGGWSALGTILIIPGILYVIFLWSLSKEMGSVIVSTIIISAGLGIFILTDNSGFQDACKSMKDCDKYLGRKFCLRRQEAQLKMNEYIASNDVLEFSRFLSGCPNSRLSSEVQIKYDSICSALYAEALRINTSDAWSNYCKSVPKKEWKDAEERVLILKAEEERKAREEAEKAWKRESSAWEMAKSMGTTQGYAKYLEYHPHGAHAKAAIDAQVSGIMSGSHGELPSMEKTGYYSGSSSTVRVSNDTKYTLTLLYSGSVDSKRLVLAPNATQSIKLKNGRYRIAASVNAYNVSSYAGNEELSGGEYSVSYYISSGYSTRYNRY